MNGLGLSPQALAERRKYVCAGDAAALMEGRWREVWAAKTGRAGEEDLSGELRVQMGLITEPFNLAWCMKQTGRKVEYFSGSPLLLHVWATLTGEYWCSDKELQVSKTYPFMACHLDGMTTTAKGFRCPIDAKHVGRSDDPMILRYTAAGTHQATVMGCDWWALSVFVGNSRWELIEQEVDPLYQAMLISAEEEFWGYVERDEEPPENIGPPALPPKPQPRLRIVQLDDEFRDTWPNWAGEALPLIRTFANTDAAAKLNGLTRDKIKKLVPEDVGEITRGLWRYKRTKAGAVTMSLKKGEDDDTGNDADRG